MRVVRGAKAAGAARHFRFVECLLVRLSDLLAGCGNRYAPQTGQFHCIQECSKKKRAAGSLRRLVVLSMNCLPFDSQVLVTLLLLLLLLLGGPSCGLPRESLER